ncbi:hypothetical protein LG52_2928 [Geobacillus kaustophilus]|uniref:Uncharacterized protein n=1 Tax=Geobacillus kaustophilus TaxID=1462 RepID=A0A0D8BP75_GEOKU|nr:hypothetical protein LG52_2928 [Geobacillus kaustophilus]
MICCDILLFVYITLCFNFCDTMEGRFYKKAEYYK